MKRRDFIRTIAGGTAAVCGVGAVVKSVDSVFAQEIPAKDYTLEDWQELCRKWMPDPHANIILCTEANYESRKATLELMYSDKKINFEDVPFLPRIIP